MMKYTLHILNIITLIYIYNISKNLNEFECKCCSNSEIEFQNKSAINTSTSLKDSVIGYIDNFNFKHKHIILAQAILETGNFSSNILHINNNLFGMKVPYKRLTVALKSKNNSYAEYKDIRQSVSDRALYEQFCNLHIINDENEYIEKLSRIYAEDANYAERLKNIVSSNNLKELYYGK